MKIVILFLCFHQNINVNEKGGFYMNYETFKDVVVEKFKDYMPEEFQDIEVHVESLNEVNRELDCLILKSAMKDTNASPMLYINHMYGYYRETENLEETLQYAASIMTESFMKIPEAVEINFEELPEIGGLKNKI